MVTNSIALKGCDTLISIVNIVIGGQFSNHFHPGIHGLRPIHDGLLLNVCCVQVDISKNILIGYITFYVDLELNKVI